MRIILALGLVTYWASHPAAVHTLLLVARSWAAVLLHPAAGTAAGSVILMLGSHWH